MRSQIALSFLALAFVQPSALGIEPKPQVIAPAESFRGPQLPLASEESAAVLRLASAVEPASPAVGDQALLQQKLAELDRLQAEVDRLRVATRTPQQILVKVEVLEVSLTKLRKLGIDFARSTPEGFQEASLVELLTAEASQLNLPAGATANFLDMLKQNNIAKPLSDPTIVVASGRPASFLVGGQFPVPAAPGATSSVEFREFGTRVDVVATSLGNDRVRLEILPRISEIDESLNSVDVQGRHVPGLRVQECDTRFEAQFGEASILGGLTTVRLESVKHSDGRVEERQNEIATWYVVRTEQVEPMDPHLR